MSEDKGSPSQTDYREYVRKKLESIAPIIEKVSLGEFDEKIEVPRGEEDEFSELMVGLNLMIEDLRFMFDENQAKTAELERRLTELSVLNEIARVLGSTLKLDELMEVIYQQTLRVMDTESFYIALYDENNATIEFPLFIEGGKRISLPEQPLGKGLTQYIIHNRKSLLIRENMEAETEKLGIESTRHGDPALCWLGVPMISADSVIGVISVQSTRKPRLYDEGHERLLLLMANAAASAVANARSYRELQRKVGELSAFNEVGQSLGTTLKLEERLRIIYEQARKVMPADHFYVALYHSAEDDLQAEVEFVFYVQDGKEAVPHTRTFNNGLTEHIIKTREPLLIQRDLRKFIDDLNLDVVVLGTPAKSWLGVPLIARGEVVGVMAVQSVDKEEAYDEGHKDFLISLASQASGAIDNARAYRELENRLTELSVLNEISRAISSTLDIEELYDVVRDQISRLMTSDNFYIARYHPDSEEVSFPYAMEQGKRISTGEGEWMTRRAGHGMTEYVIRTAKPQLVQGDSQVELAKIGVNHIGKASHSWLGAPMIARNQVIGVVGIQAFDPEVRYTRKHMRLLQLIASQAAPAVENARAYAELEANLDELRRAQEALREREELYRTLINTSQEAILLNATDDTILFANPAASQIFGCSEQELVGQPFFDYLSAEDAEMVKSQTASRIHGETSRYEVTIKGKDGSSHRVLVNAAPTYDRGGNYYASMGILTDITEISAINETIRAISSTLNIEELYRVLHQQIKRLMSAENFYIALYDSRRDEVSFPYAFQDGELQGWKPRRGGNGMTEHVIRSRKTQLFLEDSKTEASKRGVEHIGKQSFSWLSVPMMSRNEVVGVMTVQSFDPEITYTDRHAQQLETIANQAAPAVENARAYALMERRVEDRTAELQKSNEALEDFVYTVSHDLKAPLRAILGFSQFLLEDFGSNLPEEGVMYVNRMSLSAKRMERLIDDLLELSRVGRIKEPYEEIDVDELLSEIITTLSPSPEVMIRVEGPMPRIVCERVRIGQVFSNLISNAIKYNDKEQAVITVGYDEMDEAVEFFVSDNGPGIEERHFDRIFKIFQRLSSDEAGTGIGLALVKKIIEDHKGNIKVESDVGQGTTFRFLLPKRVEKPEEY